MPWDMENKRRGGLPFHGAPQSAPGAVGIGLQQLLLIQYNAHSNIMQASRHTDVVKGGQQLRDADAGSGGVRPVCRGQLVCVLMHVMCVCVCLLCVCCSS
jgi:hypothetical protein